MNSVEQLIRQKLSSAILAEKRRIGASILEMNDDKPMSPLTKPDPAATHNKRKAKQDKIAGLRDSLTQLQNAAGTSKDPAAMKGKIDALRGKIQLAQTELSQIK